MSKSYIGKHRMRSPICMKEEEGETEVEVFPSVQAPTDKM